MPAWIFGYGSLVWRPAFEYRWRQPARLCGWARRFWQGSTDHRGVPGAPGRVVTLVPDPGAETWGMAYGVEESELSAVLEGLDQRERGGYERFETELLLADGTERRGLVYRATSDNPNYLGPAPVDVIATQVRRSTGPSGPNIEYVVRLAEALREMGVMDEHIESLARILRD